ncbi:hypothetical protein [Alkalihalophilus marmarensis]|uniref:hypothetical protein n=1 Tax=Alkalihalophilus marmarensis TaxID=521377 RepID=UPI002DBB8363|nr:hypothetical protein [Alkalihalophilus marmarensis]MEC2074442.1 hypothetical protein [Alkalihalophilus marmarensis]
MKYEVGVLHSHLHILNSEDISERIVDYVILNVHHSALSLRNLSIHYDIEDDNNNLPNALFNLQSTLQELDIDQIRRIDLSAELNSMINIMQDPNYSNKKNNEFIIDITNEVNRINQRFLEGKTNSK